MLNEVLIIYDILFMFQYQGLRIMTSSIKAISRAKNEVVVVVFCMFSEGKQKDHDIKIDSISFFCG